MVEAVAQFDYKAQEPDELTLQKGDVITEIIIQPGGWWEGMLRGKRGMFPDNFVKITGDEDKSSSSDVTHRIGSGRKCKVLFSYHPVNNDELRLQINDIIEILDEVEEGWWKGKLRNDIGVFPSNFVSELSDEQGVTETASAGPRKSKMSQDETAKTTESAINHEDVSQSSSRSTSLSTDSDVPVLPPKPVKEICKVIFPYKAANDDELTLREGEIITVVSKDGQDKGWWRGELNGQVGVFPDNFVQLLPVDETSKPGRPPMKTIGLATNRVRDSLSKPSHLSSSPPHGTIQTTPPLTSSTAAQRKSLEMPSKTDEKTSPPGIVNKKPTLPPPPLKKPQRSPSGTSKPLPATSPNTADTSHQSSTSPLGPVKQSESPSTGSTTKSPLPIVSSRLSSSGIAQETSPLQSTKPSIVGVKRTDASEVDGSCLSVGSSPRSYNLNHSNEDNNHTDADIDLDCIGRTAMLTHPTASRVRAPRRRPPSSVISKDDGSPGMMNGSAEPHLEKQGSAAMSLVEELKLNYAKKSMQGRTRVMIGQPSGGGDAASPDLSVTKPPNSTGVVFRNLPTSSAPRPQSMFSGEKSPNPRPLPALTTPSDTLTIPVKQWTEMNDKLLRLETTVENQREHFSKAIKDLTSKLSEVTERVLQMQLDIEKVTDLVTQV